VPSGFPKIVTNPRHADAMGGGKASFECNATGNPPPVLTWLKKSVPLNSSADPRISIPEPGIVNISAVQASDAGRYICVASNSLGMVYARAAVLIHRGLCHNDN